MFIADQLNTHKSASLVECVAELCGVKTARGEKGKFGILLNMASRAEFLQDTGHRIRFVYTPKHCSWLNQVVVGSASSADDFLNGAASPQLRF
ncbi:MAG: transposase [Methylovulum sp.]|nr:transposase [Methylovulum sp.]